MATYSFIPKGPNNQQIVRGDQPNKYWSKKDGPTLQEVTDNGATTTNVIEVAGLDVGTSTHTAVAGEAYFEDTDIIVVGGNIATDGAFIGNGTQLTGIPRFTYTV